MSRNEDRKRFRAARKAQSAGAATSSSVERSAHGQSAQHGEQLYGITPVLEILRSGSRQIEHITIAEGAHSPRMRELLDAAREARVPVRRISRALLARAAGSGANHQGVLAAIAAAKYSDAEDVLSLMASRVGSQRPPLIVALDGVEDPRNLGAILRTVECSGGDAVFIPERRAVGLTDTVAKAAAGALEHVPVARATNFSRLIEELNARNIWTVGTAEDAEQEYTEWDWTTACAIFLGSEGTGLHRLVRERCDALVRIPTMGKITSLNVSVAAGVILYEAVRQRSVKRRQ